MNVIGFGAFTKNHKNFWSFDLNVRVNEDANLPYSLFEFIKLGKEGQIRNFGTSTDSYLEAAFTEEGATLIFIENYPEDVPGYGQLEKRRKNFAGWRKQLPSISTFDSTLSTPYQKGTIITGKDYGAALAKSLVFPEEMKVLHGLQYIRPNFLH